MPHTLHIVSHTHWDREWYLTFQQFRMRLVDLVDHLLDLLDRDPDFISFHLDSQTIVLEDYLAIKPQNRERLARYIRSGRIIIGPWYQLNDEFLTSGEATIRSLLIGTRIAHQFGACAAVGYLPDQFGNLSQMPQIFRGFGIDNAIMGRGYQRVGDRKMEFLWKSPDGSQVTASLMAYWYNNAQHVPEDPEQAQKYIEELHDRMAAHSVSSHLLLMNGVDHLEPQQSLSPILKELNQRLQGGDRIIHSTVEAYINAVKKEIAENGTALETHTGELREDRGGSVLAGTLSTRMYLKQANHHAQVTLEKFAEPLAAFAMQEGERYPQEFLHYAWKLLMQNHPHDSICGCSIDQVHREMMPRFAQVEQVGEELIARASQAIADRVALAEPAPGEMGVVVLNTLNWVRTDPVQVTLVYPLGDPARGNPQRDDSRKLDGIKITGPDGEEVPFAVMSNQVTMRTVLSPVELPLDQWVQEISVEFVARDVPACGYQAYRVTPVKAMPQFAAWDDPLDLHWEPYLESCGDVGDEYLYRKPVQDQVQMLPLKSVDTDQEQTAVRQTTVYRFNWQTLSPKAGEDGSSRVMAYASCRTTTWITRWRDCPRMEFTTYFDNQVKDHRLRVVFQNRRHDFQPEPYSVAEGQFDVLRRPLAHPHAAEGAATFHPQQNWVALEGQDLKSGERRSVAVINQGLPEYEIYNEENDPKLAVTLLRCVGYLSRRGDGPQIETPEAQCIGEHTFHYALLETSGGWEEGKLWKQAHQFNAPLRAVQTDLSQGREGRYLPAGLSFLTVEPDTLVVTAIKRAEDELQQLIVRFFNISDQPVSGGRVALRGATAAWKVNLNEEAREPLAIGPDGALELPTIRPKEIVTLAFQLK